MNTQITITENGTTTLATAGKYCHRNIDVNVEVDDTPAYEAGQKAENDAFWDAIQNNGKRTDYERAFSLWSCEYIRPKYKVIPTGRNVATFSNNTSLKKIESQYFDFSQIPIVMTQEVGGHYSTFAGCESLEEVEDIGMQAGPCYWTFGNCYALHTIATFRSIAESSFNNTFIRCHALENITIEGTIGKNGFNVQWSTKLSKASIESIINALSSTTSGLTVTISKAAKEAAFTTEEWATLIATKPNWTISLA